MGKYRKYEIEDKNRESIRVYCKYCGHTNSIPAFRDSKICSWCKRLILNDSKAHFQYKMRNILKKEGRENGEEN